MLYEVSKKILLKCGESADLIAKNLVKADAPDIKSFHVLDGPTGVGAALITLNISHFMSLEAFKCHMDNYITRVKSIKKAKEFEEIYLPGEIEYRKEQESYKVGVELDEKAVTAINELLKKIGSDKQVSDLNK